MTRSLSMIGLLIVAALGGWLMIKQLQSSAPQSPTSAPTTAIDKANKAAETVENQTDKLQHDLNQP